MKNKIYLFCAASPDAKALSHALLFEASRRYFAEISEAVLPVRFLPSGKPVFPGSGHFLSLSHAEGAFLAAFGSVLLGVDLERRGAPHPKAARRCFDEAEQKEDFYAVWTRKEAAAKLDGRGLAILSKIRTSSDFAELEGARFLLKNLEKELPVKGYAAHLAVSAEEAELVWL